MDVDQSQPEAGPSRPPTPPPPPIYFPPFPPPLPTPVSGTQDLLTRYHLLPYYAHHARPYLTPVIPVSVSSERKRKRDPGKEVKFVGLVEPVPPDGTPRGGTPVGGGRMDVDELGEGKGKGKERETVVKIEEPEVAVGKGKEKEKERGKDKGKGKEKSVVAGASSSSMVTTPSGGKRPKLKREKSAPKVKHGYRHYLWGLKGRVNTKKDRFLLNLIQAPPKQPLKVKPLEAKTIKEAFKLQEGVLPDYDPLRYTDSPLISEKKKRKLAEKAARLAARERAKQARAGTTTADTTTAATLTVPTTAHPPAVHVSAGGVPTPATTSGGTPPGTPGSPLPGSSASAATARKPVGSSNLKNAHRPPGSPSRSNLPFPKKVSSPLPQVSSPLRQAASAASSSSGTRPGSLVPGGVSQPRATNPISGKPVVRPGGVGVGEKRKEPPDRDLADERERQRVKKSVPAGIPGVGKGGKKRKVNGATA